VLLSELSWAGVAQAAVEKRFGGAARPVPERPAINRGTQRLAKLNASLGLLVVTTALLVARTDPSA